MFDFSYQIYFFGEGLLVPRLTPMLEDHTSPFVRGGLFNIFAVNLRNWRPFLHPQPVDFALVVVSSPYMGGVNSNSNIFGTSSVTFLCGPLRKYHIFPYPLVVFENLCEAEVLKRLSYGCLFGCHFIRSSLNVKYLNESN
jgi:hypothetical protein